MPDFKYLVRFSDSSTAYVSAEDFEKKKDELFRVDPKAQVSKVGEFGQGSTVKDWESYQVDFPDGSSRVVDAQTFNAKRDVLGRIDGVRVSTISPVKFQNGKMYDVDSAIEAERKFKEFNSKNWDFMQNFEDQQSAARKEDPTEVYGFNSNANKYVEQNQGAYTVLKNERDKVLTEYWDNPFIKERAEQMKESARNLEREYTHNKRDSGFLSSDKRTWRRAAAYQKKIADLYEAPNKFVDDDSHNGFVRFFKQGRAGAHDVMGSRDFWTMGLTEITRNVDTYKIYNKYTEAAKKAEEEGRSLTEAEINSLFSEADKAELVGFLQYADAQKERAYTLTGAYEAGRGFAESIPYMVEFMVSQGGANAAGKAMQASNKAFVRWLGKALMSEKQISKLVKASDEAVAAGKQATYAATNYAKLGKLAKVAERADNALVKPIVQGVWHTATQPLALNKAVTERMVQMDDNGQMQGYWQSFFDELPDQLIENWSESVGGALEELMALPFKGVGSIGETTIGGTGFGRWARWMHNSAGITTLREAGFNGLIGEMAEEWAGNAVRLATGRMTTEEFKDFASLKQQLQMAASFAPMSLIGLGTGAIGAYQYSKKYQDLSNQAKEVLRRLGKSEDEINDIFNTRFDTPEDVATKLVPYAIEAGNQKENAQAVKDYATMLEFSRALGMKQVGEMIREEEDRQDRQTMRDAITATTGIDNWYQTHESEAKDKDGNPIVVEEVRVIQDSEGKTYYVLNEDASGEVVTRDEFGNTRYFSPTEMEDGTVVSDRQMMLDDYLKERSDSSKADAERQRMDETARGKLNQIKQALSQNPVINVGTAEAPNNVRFVEEAPGGARFADEAGNVYNLSWAAIGHQLGVDMSVKTDAEMEQEAVKEYDEMRDRVDTYNKMTPGTKLTVSLEGAEPFEGEFVKAVVEDGTVLLYIDDGNGARAYAEDSVANLPEKSIDAMQEVVETPPASGEQMVYTNPAGQRSRVTMVEERPESGTAVVRTEDGIETAVPSSSLSRESTSVVDNTPRDYKGNPLPLNDDGSVDEAALWDNDPKAWAVWNTDQRGDGGENSAKYIAKAIERESAELEALRNEYDNEPDFNRRKEMEENIRAHQERAGVLGSVAEEIVNGQMPYQAAAVPISSSAPSSEVAHAPQPAAPASSQEAAAQPAPIDQEAARMQNKKRLVKKAYREAKRALAKTDRQLRNATPEQRDQIMRERELILQRYLDKIKSSDVTVITYADAAESLRLAGEREDVAVSVAKELDNARKFGWKVRGFFNGSAKKPRIYILADGISSVDECRITYVHERQHGFTMEAGYVDDVLAMDGVDRESLVEWVRNLSGTNSYDGKPDSVLADEAISMAMEVAYNSTPETLEENLRARGVDNAEFINFVKTLDNEQRNDPSITLAYISERADAVVLGRDRQEDGGQDVRDSVSQPGVLGDALGEQQYGPTRSGRRGTGGGAEFSIAGEQQVDTEEPSSVEGRKSLAFQSMYKKKNGSGSSDGLMQSPATPSTPLAPSEISDTVSNGKDGEISGETNTSEQNLAEQRLSDSGIASNGDEVRFSVRYVPTEEERSGVIDDIVESTGVEREKAEQWLQSETSLAAIILSEDNAPFLDYKGDDRYTAIKQDSDYPQGTVDFNNICRKRLPFTQMYQRVQKAFPNVVITGEDLAKIRTIMKNHGITVACGLCYVEDRRQLLGEIAREFINEVQTDFKGYVAKGGETKKKNADKFRRLLGEDKKEDLSIYDLITLDGAAKLREEHPGVYDAFQAFNSARGQQAGNLFQGYAEYKREILKWNKKKVASVNANGGLRVFSYSDFEAHHLIDLVQIIQDCARKGVKIQGYTKVPAFARAVSKTGAKINRSLIPLGDTGIVDGHLAYDPVEGIDINDPDFIESNDNIGNILIGINDEQIHLAMADPFIHFIIPYHSNQSGVLRTLKQTGAWTNYKDSQNEKGADGKVAEHVNIYTDVLDRAEKEGHPITNEREFTEEFLAVCKERGLTPRFSQFLYTDENGEFIYTPGYYKFLVDFKLFDEEGRILPQQPVAPEFDDELNKRILDDYVSGEMEKLGENYDSVYDEIVDELALNGRNVAAQFGLDATKKPSSKKAAGKKKSGGLRKSVFRGAEQALESDGISIDDQALMDEYGLSNVTMSKKGDVVKLDKIVAKEMNQGNGTRFMTDLATVADRHGWTLSLTPDASFGASSVSRLKKFYKRFGFKDNKGRNTDFTINESMIRRPESDGDNEIRWSFAGRQGAFKLDENNGESVRMDNLGVAESMEEAGNDAKSIKMATGWERGADGKWRYEIGSAALKDGVFNIIRNTRASGIRPVLNDILEPGSEVMQAYPDLKYVNVTANNVRGEYGSANRPKNTINLSEGEIIKASDPVRTLKETINHEIQHFVQGYEGFAVGANSSLNPKNSESLAKAQAENPTLFNFINFFGGANSFAKLARSSADKCKESISRAVAANNFTGELLDRAKQLYRELGRMDADEYASIVKQAKSLMTKARKEAQYNYDHSAGEVEARNVSRRLRLSDDQKANTLASETEDIAREEQVVRFSKVTDRDLIAKLDSEPKIRVYRSAQFIPDPNGNVDFDLGDGKGLQKGFLYAPMSAKVDGRWRDPISIGEWEQADENPELANDNGEFVLDKGNGDKLTVAYAPYLHTRRSPLNEQFSGAYERGNLVILESEIPESELTSGYTAEKSKKSTGEHDWPSGKVSNALAKEGMDTRKVILSRWAKPIRVVPNSEVADMISELIGDRKLSFPYNVVTPGLRRELQSRGVKFSGWQGNKPKNVNEIIAGIKEESGEDVRFSITPEQDREYMDAVEAGDMETAQRLVDQAARFAFPNSTVRDGDGNLLPVYHDTNSKRYVNRETGQDWESLDWEERDAWEQRDDWDQHWEERDFYTFDRRNARTSIEMPAFFFATEEDPYHEYGERTIKAYINLTNPVVDPVIENAGVTNTAGADAMQKYIDEGYDGFVRIDEDGKPYEYGVFDANNIKSAEPVTYDDNGDVIPLSERFNEDNDDIRFSISTNDLFARAKERFGTTRDIREAGYVLPDGTMLDFSGRHWVSGGDTSYLNGDRQVDHRDIADLEFEKDGNTPTGIETSMEDFISRGAIRIDAKSGLINLSVKPTKAQTDVLRNLIRRNRNNVWVEFGDGNRSNGYAEYNYANEERVLGDINDYFDYGIRPEGDNAVRFSKANNNQRVFISNAEAALDGIQMEKATPEQWLKMLEGKGGLKAGEDKWLGLSDWLEEKTKPVSYDNYWDGTSVKWENVGSEKAPVDWIKDYVNRGERRHSPYRSSISEYVVDRKNGVIYRYSDHWGSVGGCKWTIDKENVHPNGQIGISIAKAKISDFKRLHISKEDIANFIAENRIQIEEVHYSENARFKDQPFYADRYDATESDDVRTANDTRLAYTTEGLDNKREIALTVPTIEPYNEDDKIHFGDAGEGRAVAWIRFGETTTENETVTEKSAEYEKARKELDDHKDSLKRKYADSDKPYYEACTQQELERLASLKDTERALYKELESARRSPRRVLVIDEIQSKRHQDARVEGYKLSDERRQELFDAAGEAARRYGENPTEENLTAMNDAVRASNRASNGIPAAPFEKNWHELAMKRMLRLAAEEGYDYVAWTTGEQQAERYNLGGAVDSIEINDKEGGLRDVTVKMKDAPDMGFDVSSDGHVVAATDPAFVGNKMLSDYLGKDLANRVMSAETGQSIDGDGLRIGGDGMNGFYDDILPRFMNKYGKKWGVKVDDMFIGGIGEGNRNGLTMHAVPVNEAMKESVMEGQVMFSVADGIGEISDVALKHEQLQSAPVTPITKGILSTRDDRPALQRALGWYKNNIKTAQVYDTDKGEIIIDSQSIRSTMAHKYGPEKLDAITSLFDGFNNAVYITDMVDFENDAITYSYFVYPAEYDGERVYCLCRTKITKDEGAKNRLYIHEVFSDKQIKNSTLQAAADGSHQVRGKVLYLNLLKQVVDYKGSNNSDNSKENKENSANPPLFSIQSRRAAVESVEKEGLGGIIGPENVAPLMRGIYTSLPREIRGKIVDDSMADWFNARKAFNTYLHDLAFNGTENDDTGLLFMLYDEIRDESGNYDLTNNDIRYMLWKATSDSRDGDLLALASEQAMKNRWGAASEDEEVRFSARKEFGESAEESKEKFDENTSAANEERKEKAKQARKSVREEIGQITKAMRAQKAYDKATIAGITKFAKEILKAGRVSELTTREVGRLLTLVNSTNGKNPASASRWATELLDYLLGHIVKDEQSAFMKIVNVKDRTVAQTGAEKQGKLDVLGQITVRAFRENMKSQLQTIQERLENLEERMESNDDAVRKAAQAEYDGLRLAMEYIEGIDANQEDEHQLQEELDQLKEAKSTGNLDKKSYEEYVKTTKEAIRESRIERIDMYRDMAERLSNILSGSVDRAREFREREKQRVEDIHHDANRDMQGIPTREHRRETRWQKIVNSDVMRFFLKSYATFDQMCRFFGRKNATGEGYIYNRFFRGWQRCEDAKSRGIFTAHEELDKKASEVFGRDMLWSDLYDIERGMPGMDVMFMDGGEMAPHTLTQGNMLYIYMADKMPDGRMKLRKMGITEDVVAKIKAALDPRFVKLADWLQGEYLVEKRNKYNAVHERMNGAPMADIENYFPLKILSSARHEEVDLGEGDNTGAMSSTVTGAVIKRRKNSLPLDLLHTDAFSLVIEHIDEMEDWAAFAEFRRDMNTLLSYKRFRNQVQNMTSTVYGGGEMLWDNFKAVASIATGNYKPKVGKGDLDRTALNIAKGVTGAKIAFRVNTAIKQLLSFPAYLPDARIDDLAKSMMTPGRSWNWCMENIPMFEKRWKSRKAGDTRLMDTDSDWDVWKEKVVETASRWGMTPNAFVDACTVAMGTKAMYETKKRLYIRDGYSEEEADRRAKQDAAVLFNQTQQSSEAGFVAPVQLDRTWLAVTFTTFRNSSMGYQRQLHDAIRTLGKVGGGALNNRKYDDMIQFMARQRMEDGIDEEAAIAGAKRDYWRQFGRSAARIAVFGYGLQFLWSLGSNMWYLLLGDDDDEKEKLIKDAAINELAAPVEGMVAGDILAEIWSNLVAFVGSGDKWGLSNQDLGELPAVSDAKRVLREITNNQPAALSDLINLLAQVATGVNPSTFSDMVVAVIDACNGDLDTAKEAALLAMRVLQVPQSTIDEFIIDEIDMTNAEARKLSTEQLAKRYAHYKFLRNSPYTNWLYDDGEREKKHKSQEKAFKDKVKARMDLKEEELPKTLDEDYNDAVKPIQEFQRQLNRAKDDSDAVTVADLESRKEYREYKVWKKYQREINKLKKTIDETKDESLRERAKARRDELIRKMMSELSSVQ